MTTTSLPELDALLNDWQQKMGYVGQNLFELYELPTYQRLMGEGGMPKAVLTGETQKQVKLAIDDLTQLFQLFELLRETIDRAKSLRSQVPKRGGDGTVMEIMTLLTEPSILLPQQLVPLQFRDLISASTQGGSVTASALLGMMATLFAHAKTIVLEVDEAWNQLETPLIELQQQALPVIQELTALIQRAPATVPIAIQQQVEGFQAEFRAIHQAIDADPLTAKNSLIQQLKPSLEAMTQHLADLAAQRQDMKRRLDDALRGIEELRSVHQTGLAVFAEWQDKVLNSTMTPMPSIEIITELTQWLHRLSIAYDTNNSSAVHVGLTRWQAQFDQTMSQVQTATSHAKRGLQSRIELRGQLTAMKAKAGAMGRSEDLTLATIEAQAKQYLYTRPTDLPAAERLVREYEQTLNCRN
jgi:hypothetical protein